MWKINFFLVCRAKLNITSKKGIKDMPGFVTTIIIIIITTTINPKPARNSCLLAMWIDSFNELLASHRFISKFSEITRLLIIRRILSAWAALQSSCQSLKQSAKRLQRFVQIWLCLQSFVVILSLCLYHVYALCNSSTVCSIGSGVHTAHFTFAINKASELKKYNQEKEK